MTDSKIKIDALGNGALRLTSEEDFGAIKTFPVNEVEALRAHFLGEFFEDAGWWLSPDGDFIVKRQPQHDSPQIGRAALVMSLVEGSSRVYYELRLGDWNLSNAAARAYFDANPEPKPWLEAKPGEAWVLTTDGNECVYIVEADGYFDSPHGIYGRESAYITAGRRIWPAQDGDNDE